MATQTAIPENTLKIKHKRVLDAYFVERKNEPQYEEEKVATGVKTHTVVKGDNLTDISIKYNTTIEKIMADNGIVKANSIQLKQVLKVGTQPKKKKVGDKVTFTKTSKGSLGDEVYVVVKTQLLQGKTIFLNVKQGVEAKTEVERDNKGLMLQQGDKSNTKAEAVVGAFAKNDEITNKDDFKDWAIFKFILGGKDTKNEGDIINKLAAKKASMFLLIDAQSSDNTRIFYNGYNPDENGEADLSSSPNHWLDSDGKWFELTGKKICSIDPAIRSHFVIHCTAGEMTTASIKSKTKFDIVGKKKRSAAHIYVHQDGSRVEIWPLTEKNVWATKIESIKGLKGQMFHIELNYGPPTKPSEAMYTTLADLYVEASDIEGCWPIIAPHIEVDRGIANGHQDPTDFDYNHFYAILKNKGVPIDSIPKFDHDRYWGHKSYKIPWGSDKTTWPPVLKGNPHK